MYETVTKATQPAFVKEAEPRVMSAAEIDRALEAAIDPWLAHMRWRADFAAWREGRLWQERRQKGTLNNLRAFLRLAEQSNRNGDARSTNGEAFGSDSDTRAASDDVLAGKAILDLGCGMGGLSTALALAGANVQPLDFNRHYCEITRLRARRYGLDLSPVNAAGERLPFPAASFDVVMCVDVLEHVGDAERLVAEISRCLKPGGVCQITAVNRYAFRDPHYHARFVNWLPRSLAEKYLRLVGRAKDNARFADRQTLAEMHYYTYAGFRRLLARHGLTALAESGELKLNARRGGWKGLLQRCGLARVAYRTRRALYQSTYVCAAVKR